MSGRTTRGRGRLPLVVAAVHFYGTIADRDDTANAARKVSFNRPYFGESGDGSGQFFSWELAFLQFRCF